MIKCLLSVDLVFSNVQTFLQFYTSLMHEKLGMCVCDLLEMSHALKSCRFLCVVTTTWVLWAEKIQRADFRSRGNFLLFPLKLRKKSPFFSYFFLFLFFLTLKKILYLCIYIRIHASYYIIQKITLLSLFCTLFLYFSCVSSYVRYVRYVIGMLLNHWATVSSSVVWIILVYILWSYSEFSVE